jgi:hypothetical protein
MRFEAITPSNFPLPLDPWMAAPRQPPAQQLHTIFFRNRCESASGSDRVFEAGHESRVRRRPARPVVDAGHRPGVADRPCFTKMTIPSVARKHI